MDKLSYRLALIAYTGALVDKYFGILLKCLADTATIMPWRRDTNTRPLSVVAHP